MEATINYKGVDFDVDFEYTPEEKRTRDYPGYPEYVEIFSISHKGTDFMEFFDTFEEIEEMLIQKAR
jgi:hypothetical protein